MTKMLRKITAVILTLIMVAGLLPLSAFAAQTDAAETGADLVSLTVYAVTPGTIPVKSITPSPVKIEVDSHGYPVYWFERNTMITELLFGEPNIYGNVWMRTYLMNDSGGTRIINRNTPFVEYQRTYGLASVTMDQNYTLYHIWAKGVSHSDGDDTDEYNHLFFDYDSSKVDIYFPKDNNKAVFWDFDRMAASEPVDFSVYGKSGYYVSDLRYLFKNYKTGEILPIYEQMGGLSFDQLNEAIDTPKLDTVSTASNGGRYRFWVNGPNNYQTEIIRVIALPYRKLSVNTDTSLVSYSTSKNLSELKQGEKVTVTFNWPDAYVLNTYSLSGVGSLNVVSQTSTSLKAEVTVGEGNGTLNLSVKGDPNKFFGITTETTYDGDLVEYVADINKVNKISVANSSVPAGTEVTVNVSSEVYAELTSLLLTSNTPGKIFNKDITAARKFTMPDFAVKVIANYGINRTGGYYTADINEIKAPGNESTAGFVSESRQSSPNSGARFNFTDGAQKRIVKAGDEIKVALNAVDGPNGEKYAFRIKVREKDSLYGGSIYGTASFNALSKDMTVDVTIDEGHNVRVSNDTNVIFYVEAGQRSLPVWLSVESRTFLPEGTPVFVEEDTAWINRTFPDVGEDYEITFRLGSGSEVLDENIRGNFDIGGGETRAYFSMPDRDATVHLTQLFYMPMNLNVIGNGTASLERLKDGEWVAAEKVLEGDSVRINTTPAYGYRVKSIHYNWDESKPYAINAYARSVAFSSEFSEEMTGGEAFTIPHTKAGMAFRTANRRLYVDVEFERDPSVHLHELTKVTANDPSCTEPGNIEYWACTSDILPCGKCFADENGETEIAPENTVIQPLGHSWGDWSITKPATAAEEGEETHICTVCKETETRSIGYLHTVIWLNGDGTELDSKTYLERDAEPTTYKRAAKADDAEYQYAFSGWDEGTVSGLVKTYSPLFTRTEKPLYMILVGSGTANPTEAKEGKLITLTPDGAPEGMRFTGWHSYNDDIIFTGNTFIMPGHHVEVYASYGYKLPVYVSIDFSADRGYDGKPFTVSGAVYEDAYDEKLLDLGGSVTITFSSGAPEAEGAVSYTVPVEHGTYQLDVDALTAGNETIWVSYSGDGEYGDALTMDKIRIYGISRASLYNSLFSGDVKTVYQIGDALNTDNLFIWIYWMDGSEEDYPVTPGMVSGFDSSTPGEKELTVTCPYPTADELTYTVTVEGTAALLGDVDGDGKVDIFDVSAIQKSLAGKTGYVNYNTLAADDLRLKIADVDRDGKVDIFDVSLIQKWMAGSAAASGYGIGETL